MYDTLTRSSLQPCPSQANDDTVIIEGGRVVPPFPGLGEPAVAVRRRLAVPPSRLPATAPQQERELDIVLRVLYACGGSATMRELASHVPAALNRTPHGGATPLAIALRTALRDGTVACEYNERNSTYHLTNSGAIRLGLATFEHRELRELLSHVDQLRAAVAALAEDRASGWANEQYDRMAYQIAEIIGSAGMAAMRAGVVAHKHHYAERVDVAFQCHGHPRGR